MLVSTRTLKSQIQQPNLFSIDDKVDVHRSTHTGPPKCSGDGHGICLEFISLAIVYRVKFHHLRSYFRLRLDRSGGVVGLFALPSPLCHIILVVCEWNGLDYLRGRAKVHEGGHLKACADEASALIVAELRLREVYRMLRSRLQHISAWATINRRQSSGFLHFNKSAANAVGVCARVYKYSPVRGVGLRW